MTWISHWWNISDLRLLSWGLLSVFCLLLLAGLYVWNSNAQLLALMNSKLRRRSIEDFGSGFLASLLLQDYYPSRYRLIDSWKVAGMAVAVLALTIATIWTEVVEHPVYEYHDVRVLRQVGPRKWLMEKADGRFLWQGCSDYDVEKVIWPGYLMHKFRYEDLGGCGSIRRSDLGVWWERDAKTLDVIQIAKEN